MTHAPITAYATASTLAGIGALHVAWGRGSSFPFATRNELADAVVGNDDVPGPAACYAVATLLAAATVLVATAPTGRPASRVGATGVAVVLLARAALGFAGRTDAAVAGSTSRRFRRLDRQVFSPFCVALAVGALSAARRPASGPT